MGWKPAQQHGHRDVNHEGQNLPAQERIPLSNNKRRNALTVYSLREDVLRQLGIHYTRDNQGNQWQWRENAEINGTD